MTTTATPARSAAEGIERNTQRLEALALANATRTKALADEAEVILRGDVDAVRFSDPELQGVVLLSREKYDELTRLPRVRRRPALLSDEGSDDA